MPSLESISLNMYKPRTRPIYQLEPKLGFGPIYESEPKISSRPDFLQVGTLGNRIIGYLFSTLLVASGGRLTRRGSEEHESEGKKGSVERR